MLRHDALLATVDNLVRVHNEWVDSENRPSPDETYWDAVSGLIETFDSGDIPADCRKLSLAVEEFAAEVDAWDDRDDPDSDLYPGSKFWERYEDLVAARGLPVEDATTTELAPLEPRKSLHEQGVPHRQIAQIYGLKLANGEPATHLVQRELDRPGSVINGNWRDPRVKHVDAGVATQASAKQAARSKLVAKAEEAVTICPESARDLWEQGVGPEQAARMLKRSLTEVTELFADFDAEKAAEEEEAETVRRPVPKKRKPKPAKKVKASHEAQRRGR